MKLPTGFATITEASIASAIRDYVKPGLVFILRIEGEYHTLKIRSVNNGVADVVSAIAGPRRICREINQRLLAKAFVAGRLTICLTAR